MVAVTLQKCGISIIACIDQTPTGKSFDGIPILSPDNPAIDTSQPIVIGVYNPSPSADHHRIAKYLQKKGFHTIISFLKFYVNHAETIGPYINLRPSVFFQKYSREIHEADQLWADSKSKELYHKKLTALMYGDLSEDCHIEESCQYWPSDLILSETALKFADLGACDGDTIESFLRQGILLERIWAFEPDPQNFKKLLNRLQNLKCKIPITLFPLGVGSRPGQLNFCASGNASAHIAEHGQTITMCRLDDILFGEFPNYIKLDIEGFEMEALIGMKEIITREHPVLAVSVYHNPEDLFNIPLLLKRWYTTASFFLRQHGGNFFDTVCYVIPAKTYKKR